MLFVVGLLGAKPLQCLRLWKGVVGNGNFLGFWGDGYNQRSAKNAVLRARAIKDWGTEYGATSVKDGIRRARKPDRVLVEAKASGQSLLQDLRLAKVPAVAYNPGNADKISRAHQAAPTLELGYIWVPESGKNRGHAVSWAQPFIKQLAKFPVAAHDDYVDTFTQVVIFLRNDGWFELPQARERDEPQQFKRERVNPYAA